MCSNSDRKGIEQISKRAIQEDRVHFRNQFFPASILRGSWKSYAFTAKYFELENYIALLYKASAHINLKQKLQNLYNVHAFRTGFNIFKKQ